VAEVLIWKRTAVSKRDERFARAAAKLNMLPLTAIAQGNVLIQQMQTTVRMKRQLLNNHARTQGFLLTSSYLLDKTSLTLRQLRRAKAGDLHMLTKLARKHRDSRVLDLIAKRNLDPTKATAISWVHDLVQGWVNVRKAHDDDEVAALELAIQENAVATLAKLRSSLSTRQAAVQPIYPNRMDYVYWRQQNKCGVCHSRFGGSEK
jgi:hypothetical protein